MGAADQKPPSSSTTRVASPFKIEAERLTGVYDTGDVLANVLDELEALLDILLERAKRDWTDESEAKLLNMAHRKACAASSLYDDVRPEVKR